MKASVALLGLAASIVASGGCSTVSNWMKPGPEVIKTGPDTYKVRAGAGGGSPSDAEIKSRGIKLAGDYCDAQGKHALVIVTGASGWHLFSTQTPEVTFVCDDVPQVKPLPKTAS